MYGTGRMWSCDDAKDTDRVSPLLDITEIQSHPAILEQCQDFLDATLPEHYRAVLASNTASAAEQVSKSDEFGMYAIPTPFISTTPPPPSPTPLLLPLHGHGTTVRVLLIDYSREKRETWS